MPDTSPEATADVSPTESLTDPEALRDHEDVTFTEETEVHDDRDYCASDVAGRAIVGLTDDAGAAMLVIHEEASVAMLPHGAVEPGGDWVKVARHKVGLTTSVPFELDGVECVREIEHLVEGDDQPDRTTYNVVFRASLAGDSDAEDPSNDENDHWDADWFDSVPENLPDGTDLVEADVRLFVD